MFCTYRNVHFNLVNTIVFRQQKKIHEILFEYQTENIQKS